MPQKRWPLLATFIWFTLLAICLAGLLATILLDLYFNAGVSYGKELPRYPYVSPAQLGANPVGVNTLLHLETDPNSPNLERSLDLIKAGGFGFIRQLLPWEQIEKQPGVYDWTLFDRLVELAQARGIQIMFRLDRPPPWSRLQVMESWTEQQKLELTGPPDNFEDFYNFAAKVAGRYKGRVKYYQVWNEPNLTREWNGKRVDAAAYTELLKGSFQSIKSADPAALVISAPLAPTDVNDSQIPSLNDLVYLDKMYEAGAKDYFDIMGLQIYGLGYAPDFRFVQPDFKAKDLKRVNFNRPALLREVMLRHHDDNKPAWVAEYGWVAIPPDQSTALQNNVWGNNVNEAEQARYLVEGIERARREWPWIGVMTVWFFRADPPLAARSDDPTNYFSIVTPDYQLRPAYSALQSYNRDQSAVFGTGWQPATNHPGLQSNGPGGLRMQFEGERLEIELKPNINPVTFRMSLSGQPAQSYSAVGGQRLTLAEGLKDTATNSVFLLGLERSEIAGFYVSRDNHWGWLVWLGLVIFGAGSLLTGIRLSIYMVIGLGMLVGNSRQRPPGYFSRWIPLAMVGLALLFYFGPVLSAIAAIILLFPLCFWRPDWAIGLAVFCAPLYLHPRNLRPSGRLEFTLTEILIVELGVVWLALTVWHIYQAAKAVSFKQVFTIAYLKSAIFRRRAAVFGPLALPLIALLILGTISLLVVENYYLKYALREYRLVIVEPIALFGLTLAFIGKKGHAGAIRLVDFLVLAGVMVAGVGLWQFLGPGARVADSSLIRPNQTGTNIATEGVTRIVSVYAHPDNLGLFLGRVIPLALAIILFSGSARPWRSFLSWPFGRQQWYALALLPIVAALALSYSRGAWIGVAVAILALFIAAGARRWLIGYGVLGLLGLAALPFIKVERITNLFNFVSGSSSTRLYVWQSATQMIQDHPIFGLGLDQFLYYYNPQYVNPLAWTERFTSHPHNLILDFWLRLGILGPVVLGWLVFSFFFASLARQLRRPAILEKNRQLSRGLALGLFASMVDFAVHGLVDNSYFVIDLAIVLCLSAALVEIENRKSKIENLRSKVENRTLT